MVPHLLEYYVQQSTNSRIDQWLIPVIRNLEHLLPENRPSAELIVLLGGVLASVYSFIQFAVAPMWGRLSDRIGRRPVLILTSCGLALAYFLWFTSTSFSVFLLSRILAGLMAGNLGVISAAMADMTDSSERTKAMGLLGATFGVGFILGPVIGGTAALLDLTKSFPAVPFLNPYSMCALVSVLMSVSSAFVNFRFFAETRTPVAQSERKKYRLFETGTDLRGVPHTILIIFLFTMLFSAFEFSMTFFYKFRFSLTPAQMGLIFLYLGLLLALGQGGLVRRIAPILKEKRLALLGLFLIPVPLALLGLSTSIGWSLLALAPLALGAACIRPALSGLASLLSPADHQGAALGLFRSSESLGRAIGPLAGAYLYWVYDAQIAYTVLGILILLTGFLALLVRSGNPGHNVA